MSQLRAPSPIAKERGREKNDASKRLRIFELLERGITDRERLIQHSGAGERYVKRMINEFNAVDAKAPPTVEEKEIEILEARLLKLHGRNNSILADLYRKALLEKHRLDVRREMNFVNEAPADHSILTKIAELNILKQALVRLLPQELRKRVESAVEHEILR